MARWRTHHGTSRIWWHWRVALFYLVDVVWWIFWWEIVGKIVGILAMWRILLGYGDILGISLGMLLVVDIVWRCNLTLKLEDSLNWVPHSILLFKIWIPFFQKLKWPILRTTLLGSGNVGDVLLGKGMWWVGWEWLGDGVIFIGQLLALREESPSSRHVFSWIFCILPEASSAQENCSTTQSAASNFLNASTEEPSIATTFVHQKVGMM